MNRIETTWSHLAAEKRKALILYLTIGYPERELALELVPRLIAAGADMVELGVPFSDPLAEGVTVQGATQRALANGVTMRYCIETVHLLRERGVQAPLLFMGYMNPMLRYGVQRFCKDAQAAGVDGLIFPDLPPEESGELDEAARQHGIDLIQFLAPTSTKSRIAHVAEHARGFIYCVSVKGVTGARESLSSELPGFLDRVRTRTTTPLAVGFGISRPEHARRVAQLADGVIVGSALIDLLGRGGDVEAFVRGLRGGMDQDENIEHRT